MSRAAEIARLAEQACALFGPDARLVELSALVEAKAVIGRLPFGVDGCIESAGRYFLVQIADVWPIPERLIRAKELLGTNTAIVIVACSSPDATAAKVASQLAEQALKNGFGLGMALPDEVVGVFPPAYSIPSKGESAVEFGHIPKALLDMLDAITGCFSEHSRSARRNFQTSIAN